MNYVNRAVCAALLAIPALVHSQPVPYWSATDPRDLNRLPGVSATAFDAAGNSFLFGIVQDYIDDSGDALGTNVTFRLTKFSPSGQKLWATETFFSATDDFPYQERVWPTSDGGAMTYHQYTDSRWTDGVLTKYDSNGKVQWHEGPFDAVGVAADGSAFGSLQDPDGTSSYLFKLSSAGVQLWATNINMHAYMSATIPDGEGGAWAAGRAYPVKYGPPDLIVFHFNSSGQFQSSTYDGVTFYPTFLKSDSSGSLVICGIGDQTYPTETIGAAKISSDGSLLWAHTFTDPISYGLYTRVPKFEVDSFGNVFANYMSTALLAPVLLKLGPDGSTLWTKSYVIPGSSALYPAGFVVDPGGNAFALYGHADKATSNYDYNLVKYLPSGNLGWLLPNGALVYDRGPVDGPAGIGRDQAGFLYMAGISQGDGTRTGHNVVKLGPANNAAFISQSVPSSMVAGQTYAVALTFNNNGVNPWSSADNDYLRFSSPTDSDLFGMKRVNLGASEVISAGGSKTFKFNVIAPMNGGNYGFQYRMAQGSSSFGGASPLLNIPVVVRQHAARYLSQSVPSSVKAGSTFSVTVTMENVGTNTWTKAAGYVLASTNPDLNSVWGVSTVPMGSLDSITRGHNKVFTINCVAPATPGSYTMRWMMRRQASAFTGMFGDKTTTKTITVTP